MDWVNHQFLKILLQAPCLVLDKYKNAFLEKLKAKIDSD
tara:strand:+ start:511 stop:627 length:117 start_codon:yes stop_codon:yes gene_type:complete